jgi:hypothetical protein
MTTLSVATIASAISVESQMKRVTADVGDAAIAAVNIPAPGVGG